MRTPPIVAMYTYPVSPYIAVKIMLFSLVANIPACGDNPILVNLKLGLALMQIEKTNDKFCLKQTWGQQIILSLPRCLY